MSNDLKQRIIKDIHSSIKSIGLNKLNDIIYKSENEKREYGLKFCKNEFIYASEVCAGEECHVIIKDKCKNPIGTFHTHPHTLHKKKEDDIEHLSTDDTYSTMFKPYDFACIGFVSNNKLNKPNQSNKPTIRCFIPAIDILPGEATIAMKLYMTRERYNKKIKEFKIESIKADGTNKNLNELLVGLSEYEQKEITKVFNEYTYADSELYRLSDSLATKNRSKLPDLEFNKYD